MRHKPQLIMLATTLWIISVISFALSYFYGYQVLKTIGTISGLVYIPTFTWLLVLQGLSFREMAQVGSVLLINRSYGSGLAKIIGLIGLLIIISLIGIPHQLTMQLLYLVVSIVLIFRFRHLVEVKEILIGFLIGIVLFISDYYVCLGSTRELNLYGGFYLSTIPFLFVAGAVLIKQSGFARILLLEKRYVDSLKSFLFGCLTALPPALINITGGAHKGDSIINEQWEPFVYALVPGFAEEIWARLFIITLCYFALRPNANRYPRRAMVAAILISVVVHGFWHYPASSLMGPAFFMAVLSGLLYGIPMAFLFLKRDLESAIGYHYFIDMVRFIAALYLV